MDAQGASYATFDIALTPTTTNDVLLTYNINNSVNNGQYVLLIRNTGSNGYHVRIGKPTGIKWSYPVDYYDAIDGEHVLLTFYLYNSTTYISVAPFRS
jgi:hypothetical protein